METLRSSRKRTWRWVLAGIATVLTILGATALPAYWDYTVRSKVVEGLSLAAFAKAAVAESYEATKRLPDSNEAAGLPREPALGTYVKSVMVVAGGRIVVRYNDVEQKLSGKAVEFVPEVEPGDVVSWRCGSYDIETKYLPASCREPLPAVPEQEQAPQQQAPPQTQAQATPVAPAEPSEEERFVAQLFDADPRTREKAYGQISSRRNEEKLVDALISYASAHMDNEDGVYNTVVALKDMSRTVTQPRKERIEEFCDKARANGSKTAGKCTELMKWLATAR